MEIIPTIDLMNGRCVRLVQGNSESVIDYGDPLEVAVRWANEGAKRLHVIDLDGARTGKPKNLDSVLSILRTVHVRVEVGGGIRTIELAERYLEAGADRLIISTSFLEDRVTASRFVSLLETGLIVGVDAKNGHVMTRGWKQWTPQRAYDLLLALSLAGVRRINYTDVMRDGMLEGPNIEETTRIVRRAQALTTPIRVRCGGGIASLSQLKELKSAGVEAAIVGRALYEKRFTLSQALEAAL